MPSDDLCFLIHTYRDEEQAKRLLGQIRTFYPAQQMLLITDGSPDPAAEIEATCNGLGVDLVTGDRLKLMEQGGAWVERMFLAFTLTNADIVIKLDADAIMHRSFQAIPAATWFGTLTDSFFRPSIRGGCVGFTRRVATRLLSSGILSHDRYTKLPFGYRRYSDELRFPDEPVSDEWVLSADAVIADAFYRLGIRPTAWAENCIQFRKPLPDDLSPYSVTHPHHGV